MALIEFPHSYKIKGRAYRKRSHQEFGMLTRAEIEVPEIPAEDAPIGAVIRFNDGEAEELRFHSGRFWIKDIGGEEKTPIRTHLGFGPQPRTDMLTTTRYGYRPPVPAKPEIGIGQVSLFNVTHLDMYTAKQFLKREFRHPEYHDIVETTSNSHDEDLSKLAAAVADKVIVVDGEPWVAVNEPILILKRCRNKLVLDVTLDASKIEQKWDDYTYLFAIDDHHEVMLSIKDLETASGFPSEIRCDVDYIFGNVAPQQSQHRDMTTVAKLALSRFSHDLNRLGRPAANAWFDLEDAIKDGEIETLSRVSRAFAHELRNVDKASSAALLEFVCDRWDYRPLEIEEERPAFAM